MAFNDAYAKGKVRAIGVSNFNVEQMEMLKHKREGENESLTPLVNQIEFHPYCQPNELIESCRSSGIFVEGYCPLAKGNALSHRMESDGGTIIAS